MRAGIARPRCVLGLRGVSLQDDLPKASHAARPARRCRPAGRASADGRQFRGTSPGGRSALRGVVLRAYLVVQVHRVIEVVPGKAGEAGFPAHLLG